MDRDLEVSRFLRNLNPHFWESSVTGAEAPAYYQGVSPDFAKASSGRPGRYV
jgi:hypothetical protein